MKWLIPFLIACSLCCQAEERQSGNFFLSPDLSQLGFEKGANPIEIWIDIGQVLWRDSSNGKSCESCHGAMSNLKDAVRSLPQISRDGTRLENLEDKILFYLNASREKKLTLDSDEVVALSVAIQQNAKDSVIQMQPQLQSQRVWNEQLKAGTDLFYQRMGRMNLSCSQCHDQNIGKNLRADVISPAYPTGFPVYRMAWQKPGTMDRRLRACYYGVQAKVPDVGDAELRQLELFLKVRAQGMVLDGPSLRR
jgi:sulfur-oxidizing protein SoxA